MYRSNTTGSYLSSQAASSQVLSTYGGLTTVFGMGTGGSPQLSPPDCLLKAKALKTSQKRKQTIFFARARALLSQALDILVPVS